MAGTVYRVLSAALPKLPEVEAPSLEGLRTTVPLPKPVTEDSLVERLDALRRSSAELTPRPLGAELQENDETQLDVLAYSEGKLVPFSAQEDLRLILDTEALEEPLLAALVGAPTGTTGNVPAVLPMDHSAVKFRGKPAVYAIHIKAGWAVQTLEIEDPALFARLRLGKDAEETFRAIRTIIEEERAYAAEAEANAQLLRELAKRTKVKLPKTYVEKEILRLWSENEGRFLQRVGVSPEDYDWAFENWLEDEDLLRDARRGLTNALVLRAIAQKHGLKLDEQELRREATLLGSAAGLGTPAKLDEQLAADPQARSYMINQVGYLHVIDLVREHAVVEYR